MTCSNCSIYCRAASGPWCKAATIHGTCCRRVTRPPHQACRQLTAFGLRSISKRNWMTCSGCRTMACWYRMGIASRFYRQGGYWCAISAWCLTAICARPMVPGGTPGSFRLHCTAIETRQVPVWPAHNRFQDCSPSRVRRKTIFRAYRAGILSTK